MNACLLTSLVRIHFVDNSSKMFLIDDTVEAKDLVLMVVEKLVIAENKEQEVAPYFSLYESPDGKKVGRAIEPEEIVANIVHGWENQEQSKLLFMIRLYVPRTHGIELRDRVATRLEKPAHFVSQDVYLEAAEITDEALLQTQYMSAIYNVLVGILNVSYEKALRLAGYQFYVKFGEYKPTVHKVGFLGPKIVELIPLRYLKQKGFEECENDLFEFVKDTTQYEYLENRGVAQRKYMDEVWHIHSYGRTFFRCTTESFKDHVHEKVLLAVHSQGIEIYDRTHARMQVASWSFGEIMSWGYELDLNTFHFTLPLTALDTPDSILQKATEGTCVFSIDAVPSGKGGADGGGARGTSAAGKRSSILGGFGRRASAFMGGGGAGGGGGDVAAAAAAAGGDIDIKASAAPTTDASSAKGTGVRAIADLLTDYALAFHRELQAQKKRRKKDKVDYNAENYVGSAGGDHADSNNAASLSFSKAKHGAAINPRQELAAMKKANAERKDLGSDPKTRELRAVVRLQAYVRGFQLRNEWYKEDCAILIQAVWRGYRGRCFVSEMIEFMLEEDSQEEGQEDWSDAGSDDEDTLDEAEEEA